MSAPMRNSRLVMVSAAVALMFPALAALAQNVAQPVSPTPAPGPTPTPTPGTSPTSPMPGPSQTGLSIDSETGMVEISEAELPAPPPPVELPEHARRDPWVVGRLDPAGLGLGANQWGAASGAFM